MQLAEMEGEVVGLLCLHGSKVCLHSHHIRGERLELSISIYTWSQNPANMYTYCT